MRAKRTLCCLGVCCAFIGSTAVYGGGDPPVVEIIQPNDSTVAVSGSSVAITWTATDDSGYVLGVDIYVSFNDGAEWDLLVSGIENLGTYDWIVHNRPTTHARVRVVASDLFGMLGEGTSDAFTIISAAGGRVATTLRDFDAPGTIPLSVSDINSPDICAGCHGFYNQAVEPFFNWRGSMMSFASTDPLFLAALEVANQDAPESGEICLRCHISAGWLQGRSNPTSGAAIRPEDRIGVSCDLCHRMVDPFYEPGFNPIEDVDILASQRQIPDTFVNAQWVIDPDNNRRRGPFADALQIHDILVSPFHTDAALCGTCHEVSNPALSRQPDGSYMPNELNAPPPNWHADEIMPEQRTYSEWFNSAFNTPQGVFAPEFGGNRQYVSTCQDCHMRAVTGQACVFTEAPMRNDLPLHDFSGANSWMLSVMQTIDENASPTATAAGIQRVRYMLQHAAGLSLSYDDGMLNVRVTNKSGHRLPTGYPDGRRIWVNVRFYDSANQVMKESGQYDASQADLHDDAELKVYEARLAVSEALAPLVGLPAGTSGHLTMSNEITKDNRIPPLGFSNAAYATFGMPVIGATYEDGQNWDDSLYVVPAGAVRASVTLYYQTTTREYVETLRDAGSPGGAAETMYDLWTMHNMSPPELMVQSELLLPTQVVGDLNCDGVVDNSDIDPFVLALIDPAAYATLYPNCDVLQGDANDDGVLDNSDIDGFVQLLLQ